MLAIILVAFGATYGALAVLTAGTPLLLLSSFRVLPLDRRLWWLLAAVIAYFAAKDITFKSYNYVAPTASPDRFYFDAHMLGVVGGVVVTFLLGLLILSFWFKPDPERTLRTWIAIPTTALVLLCSTATVAHLAMPIDLKRAKYTEARHQLIGALQSGDRTQVYNCLKNGTKLTGNVPELGGVSAMRYAIQQQQIEIVKLLLDPPRGRKANVNARWFREVLDTQNEELIDVFLASPDREKYIGRMLRAAIAEDDENYFAKAMALNADPDSCETYDTPLTLCAKHGRVELARRLIAAGADPNQYHGSPDLNRGCTPLITAADHGHMEMVKLLLASGAQVNRTQQGKRSALQAACRSGHLEIARLLIDAGADVSHRTATAATALHLAIAPDSWNKDVTEATKVKIVNILLDAGIDTSVKFRYGTALELAERHELKEVVALLR